MLFDMDACGNNYATGDIALFWTIVSGSATVNTATPRLAGGSYLATVGSASAIRKAFRVGSIGTVYVGVAIRKAATPSGAVPILELMDGGTDVQMSVYLNTDLTLSVRRGGSTTLATTVQTLSLNTWYWLEFGVTISDTVGTYELRLNEVSVLSATSQDTKVTTNATVNGVRMGEQLLIDDLCLIDTNSPAPTGFPGDTAVDYLTPSGAGNSTQWDVTGAASNYLAVDETAQNGDTDFVSTSTVGEIDLYALNNLSVTPAAIRGVMPVAIVRKDDAGSASACAVVRSGGTNYDQDTNGLGTTYAPLDTDVLGVDPATGVAWTAAGVNGLEVGVKLLS